MAEDKNNAKAEINTALNKLSLATLKDSLKGNKNMDDKDKNALLAIYKDQLFRKTSVDFLNKIAEKEHKEICELLKVKTSTKKKDLEAIIDNLAKDQDLKNMLNSSSNDLLKTFGTVLGLEHDTSKSTKEDIVNGISEEILLSGMKSFLTSLHSSALKAHCTDLSVSNTGKKNDLVESLMNCIFDLEETPKEKAAEKETASSSKEESKKRQRSSSPSKSPKKEDKEKKEKNGKPSSPKKSKKENGNDNKPSERPARKAVTKAAEEREKAKEKKEKVPAPKKEKYVAPPLTTIVKGQNDTHDKLFQLFNTTDLIDYCREKKMKVSGKKVDLIKRILAYLETGVIAEDKPKKRKNSKNQTVNQKRKNQQQRSKKQVIKKNQKKKKLQKKLNQRQQRPRNKALNFELKYTIAS